ncbi:type II toxin-antitoxin system PemK/MazF family toxin [Bombilactobacillus thymidiniphilus]|uniref:Type II toxin-antitoxin system PemK/MazF family toxin n=1 Tax=Bombilactobacillus thymidiniphilus TaxID=2923363 RepID=A0ABY4PBY7_9LACO|nr:type II toxin-antitoxin system PemK/MazF family toxin [Bombilactobacillus thymidiniphilus]UQS83140.1 type II toxin-antitoxin system PemK/MazF family toxin [Bombilactobacillus thymidiniphilus]
MDSSRVRQRDLVWVDFDPHRGREIKKRRPALILSSDAFIADTGFIIVAPITSTIRQKHGFFDLVGYHTAGQVVARQIYSFDITADSKRHVEFIERMRYADFYSVAQLIAFDFGFM